MRGRCARSDNASDEERHGTWDLAPGTWPFLPPKQPRTYEALPFPFPIQSQPRLHFIHPFRTWLTEIDSSIINTINHIAPSFCFRILLPSVSLYPCHPQPQSTMSAETAPLTKVDSAISGLSSSPPEESKLKGHRRASSSAAGVYNINDLGMPAGYCIAVGCRLEADTEDREGWKRTADSEGNTEAELVSHLDLTPLSYRWYMHACTRQPLTATLGDPGFPLDCESSTIDVPLRPPDPT